MALPASRQKQAIEALLRDLIALEEFSNCVIRRRQPREPSIMHTTIGEFCSRVAELIDQSVELHRVEEYAGNTANLVNGMLAEGVVNVDASVPVGLSSEDGVDCYPQQLRVVIDGLLSNAFKYMDSQKPSIRVCLSHEGNRHIFLQVANPTSRNNERLETLASDLSSGADIDWIGVTIIHLACEACEHFAKPEWRADYPFLEAKVQVARLANAED